MRLIAIGDIHGQLQKLERLMDKVRPTERDRLVFLGDYIDRGPDSKGVVDFLIRFAACCPQTIFLRGNHEQLFLDAMVTEVPDRLPGWERLADLCRHYAHMTGLATAGKEGIRSDVRIWMRNGGAEMLMSYGADEKRIRSADERSIPWHLVPQTHVDFLRQTKLWHRQDGFLFVHAGADEGKPLEKQIHTLLWERFCPPGKAEIHVVGHNPTPDGQPHFESGRYSLDTGAGNGRKLTACNVSIREFWQA